MKKPVDFQDNDSGLRVVIYEADSGLYAYKAYMNGFKVDLGLYEFSKPFLEGFKKAIEEFLRNA